PPNGDPRTPDIVITSNVGVIYTGHQKKVMEHGGFARDDTNVRMLLVAAVLSPATITSPVETTQIAPTILKALGLDPHDLDAVRRETRRPCRASTSSRTPIARALREDEIAKLCADLAAAGYIEPATWH